MTQKRDLENFKRVATKEQKNIWEHFSFHNWNKFGQKIFFIWLYGLKQSSNLFCLKGGCREEVLSWIQETVFAVHCPKVIRHGKNWLRSNLGWETLVYWLRQTAHDQEVVGSNPSNIYWMDVSDDASYYIKEKWK